jgi:hypothetical protein
MDKLEAKVMELERRLNKMMVGGRTIATRYITDAAQVISTASTTIVNYDYNFYDTHNCVTTGANWKFTAPMTAYYSVKARNMFDASTAWALTEAASLFLYKNGAEYSNLAHRAGLDSSGGAVYMSLSGSDDIYLVAGWYIDIQIRQTTGGNLALYNNSAYNYVSIKATRFG